MANKKTEFDSHTIMGIILSVFLAASLPIALSLFAISEIDDITWFGASLLYIFLVILVIYGVLYPKIKNRNEELSRLAFVISFSFLPFLLQRAVVMVGRVAESTAGWIVAVLLYVSITSFLLALWGKFESNKSRERTLLLLGAIIFIFVIVITLILRLFGII